MIAGKQRALVEKREAEMVGAMARRGDGLDGEARSLETLAVPEHRVGRVVEIMRGIEARRSRRPSVRTARRRRPARRSPALSRFASDAVIAMGMGDEDRLDLFALDRREDRREMGFVGRARIDDRDCAIARRYRCRCR